MTHKEDLKVISTWKFSYFTFDYAAEKRMLFMGTYMLKKKKKKNKKETFEWKHKCISI